MSITTSELTHRLFRKFGTSEDAISEKYIVATQVRAHGSSTDRTADAVIIGNWPSAGYEIQGFEIKISRSDWLNEIKSPNKHVATKQYCHRWWLLAAGDVVIKPGELPDDWGLMTNHGTGLAVVKPAPILQPAPPSVQFITGLMRANKRNHISEDLHAQYIQDNNRRIEAALRKEFADLRQFANFIHEAFGVELAQDKRWTRDDARPGGRYEKIWVAKLRSKWNTYTSQELKEMIEVVLSGDFDKVHRDLHDAFKNAQSALEILDKYKNTHRDHR